jgi:hypothetical protein
VISVFGPGVADHTAEADVSPFELPKARIGRRPIRLQIRIGFSGPSSKKSIAAL